MKKLISVVLCAVAAFVFAACSGFGSSVEDLLSAPKLNDDQNSVLAVLNEGRDVAVKLEYPTSGEYRTPIQFLDIDFDGVNEALLCYSDSDTSVYARLAVLDKSPSGWAIIGDIEGPGTDIYSINLLDYDDGNMYILIEWSVIGKTEHEAIIYKFSEGALSTSFRQSCIRYITADVTGDGGDELCVIYTESTEGPFVLRVVEYNNGSFFRAGYASLNRNMLECLNLVFGKFEDGTRALFVDENIGSNRQTTQAFCFVDNTFSPADHISGDLVSLAVRSRDSYGSTEINGRVLVPSQLNVDGSGMLSGWIYWYGVSAGETELVYRMYMQKSYGCGISIPPELFGAVSLSSSTAESRRIKIMLNGADETAEPLAELKILIAGEDSRIYTNEGFSLVGSTDRYRYYIKVNCEESIAQYIVSNFVIFEV